MTKQAVVVLGLLATLSAASCATSDPWSYRPRGAEDYWPRQFEAMVSRAESMGRVRIAFKRGESQMIECDPSFFVAVLEDGTVHWWGQNAVDVQGHATWTVGADRAAALVREAELASVLVAEVREIRGQYQIMDGSPDCLFLRVARGERAVCYAPPRGADNPHVQQFTNSLQLALDTPKRVGEPRCLHRTPED